MVGQPALADAKGREEIRYLVVLGRGMQKLA